LTSNREVSISAKLLRRVTVIYMVHGMLPAGRNVKYVAEEGEEIPTYPIDEVAGVSLAITATIDAIVEEGAASHGVPVPA
jgi:hypothetical protein